jgi:hypothetical protein
MNQQLTASLAVGAQKNMQRKAEKARANAKTASYIESLNSNVDTTSLSASQQSAVSNYLSEQKMAYADAARRISKLEPTHPEYMRLRDEMNGVQMNFTNLAGSLNQYKQDKTNYLKDFDNSLTRRNMIRQKLNNMISAGGRDTLLSLASDDFVIEGGLGLQDPSLFDKKNEALLKQAVLDGYMSVLEDSAAQGAIDNRPKVSGGGSGDRSRKTLDEEIPVVEDAFEFSQVYSTNVEPGLREDKTLLLVQELNAIDPTKSGNYISIKLYY